MNPEDIRQRVESLITACHAAGYARGLREGIRRMEALASYVPRSVSKEWILNQAANHAEAMRKMETEASK
jgi:hypothetical protein